MEEIKEVCGYQDARGRFFATKEKLAEALEKERKERTLREVTDKLLSTGALNRLTWRSSWEVEGLLQYFFENPDKLAQYCADYNNTNVTLHQSKDGFASISMYTPSDITVTSPITTKNKKKWYQIF